MMVSELKENLEILNKQTDLKIINVDRSCRRRLYCIDQEGFIHLTHIYSLLKGCNLTIKSALNKDAYYINKLINVHGNKYDYSKVKYTKKNNQIIIICKEHGEFLQIADDHKYGHGCPKCAFRLRKGYTKTQWQKYCKKYKHFINIVYIIRCYNDEEEFIKIGLTSKSVKERFSGLFNIPYKYDIIKEYKYTPEKAFKKEKELHLLYSNFKYVPKLKFGGSKECFSIDIITDFIT